MVDYPLDYHPKPHFSHFSSNFDISLSCYANHSTQSKNLQFSHVTASTKPAKLHTAGQKEVSPVAKLSQIDRTSVISHAREPRHTNKLSDDLFLQKSPSINGPLHVSARENRSKGFSRVPWNGLFAHISDTDSRSLSLLSLSGEGDLGKSLMKITRGTIA